MVEYHFTLRPNSPDHSCSLTLYHLALHFSVMPPEALTPSLFIFPFLFSINHSLTLSVPFFLNHCISLTANLVPLSLLVSHFYRLLLLTVPFFVHLPTSGQVFIHLFSISSLSFFLSLFHPHPLIFLSSHLPLFFSPSCQDWPCSNMFTIHLLWPYYIF